MLVHKWLVFLFKRWDGSFVNCDCMLNIVDGVLGILYLPTYLKGEWYIVICFYVIMWDIFICVRIGSLRYVILVILIVGYFFY